MSKRYPKRNFPEVTREKETVDMEVERELREKRRIQQADSEVDKEPDENDERRKAVEAEKEKMSAMLKPKTHSMRYPKRPEFYPDGMPETTSKVDKEVVVEDEEEELPDENEPDLEDDDEDDDDEEDDDEEEEDDEEEDDDE